MFQTARQGDPVITKPPTDGPGRPLAPGDVWDEIGAVEWHISPRSAFYAGASYFGLTMLELDNGDYMVWTTADELLWIVAYSQRRAAKMNNGFVSLKRNP